MARLPGVQDLGGLPAPAAGRPIATYDVSGLARGAQALSQGVQAVGKGVGQLGEGMGELALDRNRWDYVTAHADAQAGLVDLHTKMEQDTNYGADDSGKTLAQRHADAVQEQINNSAARIADPRMRERFLTSMSLDVAKSNAAAQVHQRSLENNAAIAYTNSQGENLINKAIAAPDDDARTKLIDSHNATVDELVKSGAITATAGVQMKKSWAQQYATADYLKAINSNDPAQTEAAVNRLRAAPGSGDQVTQRILQVEGEGKNSRSSATGAGQFIDSTWLDMVKRNRPDLAQGRSDQEILALRADRRLGAEMTEAYRGENEAYLKRQGLPATPGQQYLAHFLGPGAAAAVLKADPNKPVADALTAAVGDKKAAAMIAANPSILQGQLAGSVAAWADRKMGGVGDHYDLLHLDPVTRERLLAQGEAQLHKQTTDKISGFHNSVQDDLAEANRTGSVTKPKTQADFVAAYGAQHGPPQFAQYQADLQAGADKQMLASMTPKQWNDLIQRYEPQPGEGYDHAAKRQEGVRRAVYGLNGAGGLFNELRESPAQYGLNHLPAVQESWKALQDTMTDTTASPEVRRAMARDYVTKTTMEQQRFGISGDAIEIAPPAYIDNVKNQLATAAASEDPAKRAALVGQIQREAAMWGDNWPAVMRQMADKSQPIVRAIAAGADTGAMTRLLSLKPDETPKLIIGEQNETKLNDVTSEVNKAMGPFRSSLVGRQLDRDFPGYQDLAMKLAALHARDGDKAEVAATKAFNELIGNRWEFRDSWRIPKSAGVSADDVQAGTVAARRQFDKLGVKPPLDDMPGRTDAAGMDMSILSRDGKFVTSYDGAGLNLVTPGGNFVRRADDARQPFLLTWSQLAELGRAK